MAIALFVLTHVPSLMKITLCGYVERQNLSRLELPVVHILVPICFTLSTVGLFFCTGPNSSSLYFCSESSFHTLL